MFKVTIAALIIFGLIIVMPFSALAGKATVLTDEELDEVHAGGLFSEIFFGGCLPSCSPGGTGGITFNTNIGSVTLSDNAQSNLSALVNVNAANSVVIVPVNITVIFNANHGNIFNLNWVSI